MNRTIKTRYFTARKVILNLKPTPEQRLEAALEAKRKLDKRIREALGDRPYEAEYEYSYPQPLNWYPPGTIPHVYVYATAYVNVKETNASI